MAAWTSSSIITALEAPLHGVCDLMITGHHDGSVTLAAFTASGIIPNPIRHAGRQDGKEDYLICYIISILMHKRTFKPD